MELTGWAALTAAFLKENWLKAEAEEARRAMAAANFILMLFVMILVLLLWDCIEKLVGFQFM